MHSAVGLDGGAVVFLDLVRREVALGEIYPLVALAADVEVVFVEPTITYEI